MSACFSAGGPTEIVEATVQPASPPPEGLDESVQPASPTPERLSEPVLLASPTPDRMAEPDLPANPTQYEQGRHLYWLHCMTCHGDHGQGLTDEFRSLWESDHQNCWGRGCHTGGERDEGFPIPRTVPAIISATDDLLASMPAEKLFSYLRRTHPPQRPGVLTEDEYWAITAYVLTENGRLLPGQQIGP